MGVKNLTHGFFLGGGGHALSGHSKGLTPTGEAEGALCPGHVQRQAGLMETLT